LQFSGFDGTVCQPRAGLLLHTAEVPADFGDLRWSQAGGSQRDRIGSMRKRSFRKRPGLKLSRSWSSAHPPSAFSELTEPRLHSEIGSKKPAMPIGTWAEKRFHRACDEVLRLSIGSIATKESPNLHSDLGSAEPRQPLRERDRLHCRTAPHGTGPGTLKWGERAFLVFRRRASKSVARKPAGECAADAVGGRGGRPHGQAQFARPFMRARKAEVFEFERHPFQTGLIWIFLNGELRSLLSQSSPK
jgi:hypothetical protein